MRNTLSTLGAGIPSSHFSLRVRLTPPINQIPIFVAISLTPHPTSESQYSGTLPQGSSQEQPKGFGPKLQGLDCPRPEERGDLCTCKQKIQSLPGGLRIPEQPSSFWSRNWSPDEMFAMVQDHSHLNVPSHSEIRN